MVRHDWLLTDYLFCCCFGIGCEVVAVAEGLLSSKIVFENYLLRTW